MNARTESGRSIERLLIVRLSAMGDVIHTLPAAQFLREAFPHASIGWIIEERWSELLCAPGTPPRGPRSVQRPLVDWVHSVNLQKWRRSLSSLPTLEQIVRVWNDVRSERYDVAVDLQGAIRSALLARCSGARRIFGAAQPREAPASIWYTHPEITRGSHVIEQNIAVAEAVAQKMTPVPRVELPRHHDSELRIERALEQLGVRDFAILNPGAGWGAKRWPTERYGRVARALADGGISSIINYGPGEESMALAAEKASAGAATKLQTSISDLISLTRRTKLLIGGDTGPLHLAAALRVPVVAIFGPTDPRRNGPYATPGVVLRNPASPTTHARNPQPEVGMLEISVEAVVDAARTLLTRTKVVEKDSAKISQGSRG